MVFKMRVCIDGVYRDMTAEEEAAYLADQASIPEAEPSEADRIAALEAENQMLTECILELAELIGGEEA